MKFARYGVKGNESPAEVYLEVGDRLEFGIEGLGEQRQVVVSA